MCCFRLMTEAHARRVARSVWMSQAHMSAIALCRAQCMRWLLRRVDQYDLEVGEV